MNQLLSPVMNSWGATFPADVETFHMLKLARRTTRLAVRSFLNCAPIVSLSCSVSLRRGGIGWKEVNDIFLLEL